MRYIDLFAGAGGLSEGFIKAGYSPVAHVEVDRAACYTLTTRLAYHYLKSIKRQDVYESYLRGHITRPQLYASVPDDVLKSVINARIDDDMMPLIFRAVDSLAQGQEIDVIVGGPPCQAYSVVGRARDADSMRGDERNYLYRYYGRFLKRYEPKAFVFENVLGLLTAEGGKYFKNMKAYFRRIGYEVDHTILKACEFGVLQNRQRVLIIGWHKDLGHSGLPDFHRIEGQYRVDDLLNDLPHIQAGEGTIKGGAYTRKSTKYLEQTMIRNGLDVLTLHCARPHVSRDLEIYRIVVERWNKTRERLRYSDLPKSLQTHNNTTSFLDRFKVVAADNPYSHTVVAHIHRDGHHYVHPDLNQNRSISVREAARLQSFPDDFYFEGIRETNPRTAAFKQIGNAVPPLLACSIAEAIKPMLSSTDTEPCRPNMAPA